MPAHHYRITVEKLDPVECGEEGGLESISFFATTQHDLFAEARQLRNQLGCNACMATKLALGRGLIGEATAADVIAPFAAYR